uniref:Nucleotide pyrophosphatase n=1 Tax=Thermosporothrix sp. COM3 TaxID=2490863 RepID=A0A455SEJ7_9CHLR|nr:hypothetical protein KTC_06810 [Thermosporothrix sp. COM3]
MAAKCKHVFLLGLDGAGNFIQQANAPRMKSLIEESAVSYHAYISPAISAQGWGSILHGVGYDKHQVNNENINDKPYPEDSPYPSIFKVIRAAQPNTKLASLVNWTPINYGLIEQSLDVYFAQYSMEELYLKVAAYIKEHGKATTFTFVQMDDIDVSGHSYGWQSEHFYNTFEDIDRRVGVMLDAMKEAGIWDESLIILASDHGGHGTDHGRDIPSDTNAFLVFHGPGIRTGEITEPMHLRDTSPIIAQALGLEAPTEWDGKVPANLFA